MHISKHFNQTSNKILSVDEFAKRQAEADKAPEDFEDDKDLLSDLAEWQDAAGHIYISEMSVKTLFSNLAGAGIAANISDKSAALEQEHFPKMQKVMDDSEDHRDRLKAGRPFPIKTSKL